jgi:hypothetical protein
MLAYARNEDPDPHLTDDLRRFAFGNEKGIIDRTSKIHAERKERRKAVAKAAANARWHSDKCTNGDAEACKRMQTYAIHAITITITKTITITITKTITKKAHAPMEVQGRGLLTLMPSDRR